MNRGDKLEEIKSYMEHPDKLRVSKEEAAELDALTTGVDRQLIDFWEPGTLRDFRTSHPRLEGLRTNEFLRAVYSGYIIGERSNWKPMEEMYLTTEQALLLEYLRPAKLSIDELLTYKGLAGLDWSTVNRAYHDGYMVTDLNEPNRTYVRKDVGAEVKKKPLITQRQADMVDAYWVYDIKNMYAHREIRKRLLREFPEHLLIEILENGYEVVKPEQTELSWLSGNLTEDIADVVSGSLGIDIKGYTFRHDRSDSVSGREQITITIDGIRKEKRK